ATSAPCRDWRAIASSADGASVIAASSDFGSGAPIFISTNSGANWTPSTAPTNAWISVACSVDGTVLVAAEDGILYTSYDSGGTWTASLFYADWKAVCISAEGSKLAAVSSSVAGSPGSIYSSPYSGPWSLTSAPRTNWQAVSSSADAI